MQPDVLSMALAIWGAVLSTSLAAIKAWEVWRQRIRLTTSYSFTSNPDQGNDIIIENPSSTPVMISYWELLWVRRNCFRTKINYGEFPDEGYCNITVGPHSRYVLSFREQHHFIQGRPTEREGKLYLKLYIVGRRRPIWLSVYNPDK